MNILPYKNTHWIAGLIALCSVMIAPVASAIEGKLEVASLHPLMSDLARKVGGDTVTVISIIEPGADMHSFSPRPSDMQKLQDADLVLAAGKGMENYLDSLRDTFRGKPEIVEVGLKIPSLTIGKDQLYVCCPAHAGNAIDPHWWHSIDHTARAARIVADIFSDADPTNKKVYQSNAAAYSKELKQLKAWASKELSKVPRAKRKLVTAHTAYAYFAKEFGFQMVSVQGLNPEQEATPQLRAEAVRIIREENVAAMFPEINGRNNGVKALQRETGVKLAKPLMPDGAATFVGMIKNNVTAIVDGLGE